MQFVSQLGTHTIGQEDSNRDKVHDRTLEVNSMMGTRKIQLPKHKKTSPDIPAPTSVRDEDEQIQRAIAASMGSSWGPSTAETKEHLADEGYDGRMEAPLLASKRVDEKEGFFC